MPIVNNVNITLTFILRKKDKSMTILKISYITVRNLHWTAKLIKKVYCQFTTILRLFWCQCCILRFDSVAVDCKESHSGVLCIPHEWYNQLQKYLRHCTIFWINCLWPCTCDPPTLSKYLAIKDHAQNLRTNFEWTRGGRQVLYCTEVWLAEIWSQKRQFFVEESQHFCNWL